MRELPPLLGVEELAEILGITTAGVRAMIRRRELPASKLGRRWIVRREAFLDRLIAQERRRPSPDAAARILRGLPHRNPEGRGI